MSSGWWPQCGVFGAAPPTQTVSGNASLPKFLANDPRADCSTVDVHAQETCRKTRELLFHVCGKLETAPDNEAAQMAGKCGLAALAALRGNPPLLENLEQATMTDMMDAIPAASQQ